MSASALRRRNAAIKAAYIAGEPTKNIAVDFGIARQTIYRICKGVPRRWAPRGAAREHSIHLRFTTEELKQLRAMSGKTPLASFLRERIFRS